MKKSLFRTPTLNAARRMKRRYNRKIEARTIRLIFRFEITVTVHAKPPLAVLALF